MKFATEIAMKSITASAGAIRGAEMLRRCAKNFGDIYPAEAWAMLESAAQIEHFARFALGAANSGKEKALDAQ